MENKTNEAKEAEIYLVLTSNNIDTDITATPYHSYEGAFEAMMERYSSVMADYEGKCNEAHISDTGASVLTDWNDFFYWNIKKLEMKEE